MPIVGACRGLLRGCGLYPPLVPVTQKPAVEPSSSETRAWGANAGQVSVFLSGNLVQGEDRRDFLGGPVVKTLSFHCRDTGLIPGQGTKITHAMGQLSLCTTTTELVCLNERARML